MQGISMSSVDTLDSFSSLLEHAANNDFEAFKRSIELDLSGVDEAGLWYVRTKGSKQIKQEERTPLMVAATYGSVDVLKLIVALPEVDLNKSCCKDKWTALHCAAFGGSVNSFEVIKQLLSAGADPNVEDVNGCRPVDVIVAPPKLPGAKSVLEDLLMNNISDGSVGDCNLGGSVSCSSASSPVLSPSSPSDSVSSPTPLSASNSVSERKQYPVDPSLPDIRNSIYSTDEFRMFSFKIRPCSRAYSHDWTECPFVHPGENARRRDPRKFHYSCVPCPEFRKGSCRRGDMCEYAHGVFECWLHPAQYRTRLCKDRTGCARQVCFFAHIQEELRPLYVSTGSGVPSPRSAATSASFMDMATSLSFMSSSPTSHSVMSSSAFNQAMSPTGNGMSHPSSPWAQGNVPTLHLPGSNLQSSRLRSSFTARDIQQQHILNDLASFSQTAPNAAMLGRSGRLKPTLTPSNLEDIFSSEMVSSPRYPDQSLAASGVFSPSHKGTVFNQFQQQQQNMLSPITTNKAFSPRNMDHPLLQATIGLSSPRIPSPRSVDPASPMSARHLSAFPQQQHMVGFSPRDVGTNQAPVMSPSVNSWSKWGSPSGKADWSVNRNDQSCLKRSSNENNGEGDEPDLSWVREIVKESPPEMMEKPPHAAAVASGTAAVASGTAVPSGECLKLNSFQTDSIDPSALSAWLEQMQLDPLIV